MGKTWKLDPKIIREKHKWVYQSTMATEWGASVTFRCANPGCPTTYSTPVNPNNKEEHILAATGICFNSFEAERID